MKTIFSLLLLWTLHVGQAQSIWVESKLPMQAFRSDDAMYTPLKYASFALDMEQAKNQLATTVPLSSNIDEAVPFALPMPDGSTEIFMTYLAPVMEDGLARKYPGIRTFKGLSRDGKRIARFGYGPSGFHASIRTYEGEIYIDQFSKSAGQYYVAYYVADHGEPRDEHITSCGTLDEDIERTIDRPVGLASRSANVQLHVYRLALACTGVWGAQRGTKEKALEDMVISVNRLNQIYENELAIRLVLIEDNDKLIHLDPNNDGYTNQNMGGSLINQNTGRINTLLGGNGGYDIGHVYTRNCTDVGGIASLGSICSNNRKGAGVTCHYTNLLYITVQVAAHEIGHQFSAQHTFNNCGGNESFGNDFEPGGGSTIMSYGGLCGSNNIQGNNDDYYHNGSLVQIYQHCRDESGGAFDCAQKVETSNIAPVVNIPLTDNFYIPKSTYFVLTGEATDENDDAMTYSWEQFDAGNGSCPYGEPGGNCPLFRSLPAKTEPYRFFPRESRILSASSDASEVLPTYSRNLSFAFTARDNNIEGGVATWDYVYFKVDGDAGPFRLLSPGIGEEYEIGRPVPVSWDVANTDSGKVNCRSVDIFLSLDKALHESDPNLILLVQDVPNNGYAEVLLPVVPPTSGARIMVKGHNNIFFDVNDFNFKIVETTTPIPFFSMDKSRDEVCLPGTSTAQITTSALGGYTGNIHFEAAELPAGVTAEFSNNDFAAGETVDVDFVIANDVPTGTYEWTILSISDNNDTIRRKYYVDVTSTDFSDLVNVGPEEGLMNSAGLPTFSWSRSYNAMSYQLQVASSPSFDPASMVYDLELQDTFYVTQQFLKKAEVFFWRVRALNNCGEGSFTFPRSLGTINLACSEYSASDLPLNISASGMPEIVSRINVLNSGVISDLNISNIQMTHDFFKDLKATLKSPAGTEITIWENSCANKYNMNVAFDDDGNSFFNCANGISIFRSKDKLEVFNGEDPKGLWEFKLQDSRGGNGGKLEAITLEVCGSVFSSLPVLVRNEVLQIQPGNKPRINFDHLLTEDADNTPGELTYTLVEGVQFGQLLKNGAALSVGETFSQEDLNEGRIFYENTEATESDAFYFIVDDGSGGWIAITRFSIEIDENFPSATNDEELVNEVQVYPNPAADYIDIYVSEKAKKLNTYYILDIYGRTAGTGFVRPGLQRIPVYDMPGGVYLVKLTDGRDSVIKRIIIHR